MALASLATARPSSSSSIQATTAAPKPSTSPAPMALPFRALPAEEAEESNSLIKTLPYNVSIFSINSLLIPYGFDLMASGTQPPLGLNITKALI
ncbi:hypothetical protein ACSBR1_041242 [Camellia fascicularis]